MFRSISNPIRLFQLLMLLGMAAVSGIWALEHRLGVLTPYDEVGYPLAILTAGGCFLLSAIWRQHQAAKIILFVFLTGYLVSITVLSFALGETSDSIYPAASTLQWLPIIYLIGFLTFPPRIATICALAIYSALLGLLGLSRLDILPLQNSELEALLLNSAVAHAVYLFAMFGIVKLRQSHQDTALRAKEMEEAAHLDGLLGIYNRRAMQASLAQMNASGAHYSVMLVDIDHFKKINDTYGHMAGDQVLREVVAVTRDSIESVHIFGRWGGEEFLVIAPATQVSEATELAERIRQAIDMRRFSFVEHCTVSIGVADSTTASDPDAVFEQADLALYRAKAAGRNCVMIA